MLDDGVLQPVPFGNDRLVTIASVERRKREPKRAGRPRKTLTFDFPDHLKMWSVGASRSNYPIRSQGRWSGKTMIGFQSERLESGAHPDPSVFAGLEKAPMMYDGECRLGEESRECIVSVMEDGMLFIWVAVDSKGEGVLFAEGNALDGLAVFVRSQREGYFKEDFIR